MHLQELLQGAPTTKLTGPLDRDITGIFYDSRNVTKDSLFVCRKGSREDSHRYIQDALDKGAAAILLEDDLSVPERVTAIQVPDSRKAQALISANFYNHPDQKVTIIGITGTNGKTTTSYLIDSILGIPQDKTGLIGTIIYRIGQDIVEAQRTTPESTDLFSMMNTMVEKNIKWVTMEISSHALELDRTYGMDIDCAIFTNLSPEHLDYHKTMENYFAAKYILFRDLKPGAVAIVNKDDPYGKTIADTFRGRLITFGTTPDCTIYMSDPSLGVDFSETRIDTPSGKHTLRIPLPGKHNLYNAMAALSVGFAYDLDINRCLEALENQVSIPGRMEFVPVSERFYVAVDYAHTEDALENALDAIKELPVNRIICVFGCGGDRDTTKRPKMGHVSATRADITIITSDNPRTENPLEIIAQIEKGVKSAKGTYCVMPDRKKAIFHALDSAQPGDIVLIAGKGHETTQNFGDRVIHFDDREVVMEWKNTRDN